MFPTGRLAGFASSVTVKGAPGVKTTAAVSDAVPLVAVMTAVPTTVEVIDEVAMPLVVKLGESAVPMSEVKVTVVPSATGLLDSSTTVAVSALVFPTGRLAGFASSVTVKGAPGVKTTAAVSDAVPLVAVMSAVPATVEVIDEVAMPLVVELGESAVPMSEVKVTVVPSATGLLDSSTTVAVSALVFPTVRLVGFASSVTVKGAPGVKTTAADVRRCAAGGRDDSGAGHGGSDRRSGNAVGRRAR